MINTKELQQHMTEQKTGLFNRDQPSEPNWLQVVSEIVPVTESPTERLLSKYIDRAMLRAITERVEDGTYFASIPDMRDVWGDGPSEEDSLQKLASVLRAWVEWKIEDKDGDLPVIDGIDPNILS
ncbi:MAG: type II toxin-antitoxin system HicB family antitoxin [Actinomycetota bacterium]